MCPICGSPLDLRYDPVYRLGSKGLERYYGLLPFVPLKYIGEGNTKHVAERIGDVEVVFKLEYQNPSGSFKDRGSALALSYAYSMGFREAVEDSSGNAGISVALYSRIYRIKSTIVVPSTSSAAKKNLIKMIGANLLEMPTRKAAEEYAISLSSRAFYVAHTRSPFYIYGYATISYEVFEEYGHPDVFIVPAGSGGLLLGIIRGFEILKKLGLLQKIPTPIAVQGYSNQPIFRSVKGFEIQGRSSLLAEGIMVPQPPRLDEVSNAIKTYRGDVVLVSDEDIVAALEDLISMGFIVEPTSAVAYAAFKKIAHNLKGGRVLIVLTGSGLKPYSDTQP